MDNKVAIFSDLHLGIHQNSKLWHKIADEWSDWFISELKSKNITKILFLGDYFHSRSDISVNTLHVASNITDKFKDFELKMLVGNHCSFYKDKAEVHSLSVFKGYPNIEIVDKPKMFHFGDKDVFFAPWGTELHEITNCDVLMGHFEIETFKYNPHRVCEKGLSPSELSKKASLIFSGHFHLRSEREYKNSKIIYVGNPFEMYFDDVEGSKGYYILDFDTLKYEFFENTVSPRHKIIKLSEYDDSKETIKNNIVRVVVDKKLEDQDLDTYSTNIQSMVPLEFSFDHSINFDPIIQDAGEEYDLSGVDMEKAITEFVNMLEIDNKQDVIKYATGLYKSL